MELFRQEHWSELPIYIYIYIYIYYGIHPVTWVSMTSLSMSFCPGLCLSKIPIVPLQRKTVSKYIPRWVVLGVMNKGKMQV